MIVIAKTLSGHEVAFHLSTFNAKILNLELMIRTTECSALSIEQFLLENTIEWLSLQTIILCFLFIERKVGTF